MTGARMVDDLANYILGTNVPFSTKCLISLSRQATARAESLTGLGNRPFFTPAYHPLREIGIGPAGARIFISLISLSDITSLLDYPDTIVGRRQENADDRRLSTERLAGIALYEAE